MTSGIYCIENLVNGKKYIGASKNISFRWRGHLSNLKNDKGSPHLQRAWNKYGKDNFNFYILEICFLENLEEREKFWIKELKTFDLEQGYNLTTGGELKKEVSEETRLKIRNNMRDVSGINNPMFGKNHPDNIKEDISKKVKEYYSKNNNPNLGKPLNLETIKKLALTQRDGKSKNIGIKRKNATSKYHGVSWDSSRKKWFTSFILNKKMYNLGRYNFEIDAALRYDEYIKEGGFSNPLNFPEGFLHENIGL